MDGMNASLNDKMDGVKEDVGQLHHEFSTLSELDSINSSLNSKMDGMNASLNDKMDGVKEDVGQLHHEFSTLSELSFRNLAVPESS
ncbi:hypothetical protein ACOMHN_027640 [Nucella lapillus]